LKACIGDVSRAAKKAELPRGTLYRLLKKHNLTPDDFRT
jgi:transcriptional regulator of acetoin/glycerol metabolism